MPGNMFQGLDEMAMFQSCCTAVTTAVASAFCVEQNYPSPTLAARICLNCCPAAMGDIHTLTRDGRPYLEGTSSALDERIGLNRA